MTFMAVVEQLGVLPNRLSCENDPKMEMRKTAATPQSTTVALALTHLEDDRFSPIRWTVMRALQ